MSGKWLIKDAPAKRTTIITANNENAAWQQAVNAFGDGAWVKALTDAEADGMARLLEGLDDARGALCLPARRPG